MTRAWMTLLLGALLAGCAVQVTDKNAPSEPAPPSLPDIDLEPVEGEPPRPIDPATIVDAVPRWEPITAAGNKTPYNVDGKTYYVMRDRTNFQQRGMASWYGSKFHGKKTANGEVYDMYKMTAAHRNLPIPSYVRVTNLENAKTAVVRVNDRGPFRSHRIIDLSYAAAVKLGFADEGIALVKLDVIDMPQPEPRGAQLAPAPAAVPTPPPQAATPVTAAEVANPVAAPAAPAMAPAQTTPPVVTLGTYYVQVAALSSREAAEKLQDDLHRITGREVIILITSERPAVHRVRLGPVSDSAEAQRLMAQIQHETGMLPMLINIEAEANP